MRPTLQTVAELVGVSRSTVSNAYNRPDQLSAELRALILDAAKRLGYPGPNPTARSLRRGSTGAIGVLLTSALTPAFTEPYSVGFLRGLAESAQRHTAGLLMLPLAHDGDEAERQVHRAVVDGFCVYHVPDGHRARDAIRQRGLPMVLAEYRTDIEPPQSDVRGGPPAVCMVGIDERAAARAVAEHVAGLGHRRIALVTAHHRHTGIVDTDSLDQVPHFTDRERLGGFRDALAAAGVADAGMTLVAVGSGDREHGRRSAAAVLDRVPRPTAVLCTSDSLALGIVDAATARGLRPGRDVSVTGFDDIAEAGRTGLTTVRQSAVDKGFTAGQLLLAPPADAEGRRVLLPFEFVPRASTGPADTG